MKNNFLFPLFSLLLIAVSCKKEKDDSPVSPAGSPVTYDDYSGLKTGNYWVYDEYTVDTLGNATATGNSDSCYVTGDTVLGGETYHVITDISSSSGPSMFFERDSLSYIISGSHTIIFSSTDFSTVFNAHYFWNAPLPDTVAYVTSKMNGVVQVRTVPAGIFNTLEMRTTYRMYPHYSYGGPYHYAFSGYAKNIGLVTSAQPLSYLGTNVTEKRLVRYHLN